MSEQDGLVQVESRYPMDETLKRLTTSFEAKGMKIFDVIDHSGEAEKAGLTMPPTKLIIFGSPKGGTALMVASPSLAIDLPLKALAAEDQQGKVTVTFNSPEYLKKRHGVPDELIKNIAGAGNLIRQAVE